MLKRIFLASVLAVSLLSLAAFPAGKGLSFVEITTNPLEPAIAFGAGLGLVATLNPAANMTFDIYTGIDNILGWPNPWEFGFVVGVSGTEIELDVGMDFEFDQTQWSNYLGFNAWTTDITITGNPGDITEVWGTVGFEFDVLNPPGPAPWIGVWEPTFELGVRVEIPTIPTQPE